MASRQVDIVVKVQNLATRPLADVEKATRRIGKSVQDTNRDIVQFNKTLFSATAFFGTFKRAAVGAFTGLERGADFDRLANQFESLFGQDSILGFRKNLKSMSDTAVDTVEAMRAAISLNQLGIKKDLGTIATFLTKAGVAAKMAGLNSAVGIKEMTEFLKDGSISHLQHLNLISNTNAELQAGLSVTMHSNKLLGAMLSTQEKLAIAQGLLNRRTKDNIKGNRDLADSFEEIKSSLNVLKLSTATFLGKSIRPLLDNFATLTSKLSDFTLGLRLTMPEGSTFVKLMLRAAGATSALVASLGAFKLTTLALSSLGFGIPRLIYLFAGLLGFLWGATSGAKTLTERFAFLGKALESISQLFESLFDPKHLGIGEVESAIFDKLPEGLKSMIMFMTRTFAVLKTFVKDTVDFLKEGVKFLDDKFGGIVSKITDFLKAIDKPWDIKLIDPEATKSEKIARWMKVAGMLSLAFGAFKLGSKLFSKLPLVGRFFSGGGGPDGSASNPFHVVETGKNLMGSVLKKMGQGGIFEKLWQMMRGSTARGLGLSSVPEVGELGGAFSQIGARLVSVLAGGLSAGLLALIIAAIPVVISSIRGAIDGFVKADGMTQISDFFSGFMDKLSYYWNTEYEGGLGSPLHAVTLAVKDTLGAVVKLFSGISKILGKAFNFLLGNTEFGKSISDSVSGLTQQGLGYLGETGREWQKQYGVAEIPQNKTETTDAIKAQLDAKKEEDNRQMVENLISAQKSSSKIDPTSLERREFDLMVQNNGLLSDILKSNKESDVSGSARR